MERDIVNGSLILGMADPEKNNSPNEILELNSRAKSCKKLKKAEEHSYESENALDDGTGIVLFALRSRMFLLNQLKKQELNNIT